MLARVSPSVSREKKTKADSKVLLPSSLGPQTISVKHSEDEDLLDDQSSVADSSSLGTDEVSPDIPAEKTTEKTRNKTFNHSLLRPPKNLGTTMFDRLEAMYGSAIKRMLNVQYRSAKFLCNVSGIY